MPGLTRACIMSKNIKKLVECTFQYYFLSVSYTHLDVYKRQQLYKTISTNTVNTFAMNDYYTANLNTALMLSKPSA